jgi:hypothetical protein
MSVTHRDGFVLALQTAIGKVGAKDPQMIADAMAEVLADMIVRKMPDITAEELSLRMEAYAAQVVELVGDRTSTSVKEFRGARSEQHHER